MKIYHYVYRLTNTDKNRYYIGAHYCINVRPENDYSFLTSSNIVKQMVDIEGENNISKEVLSIWVTYGDALREEIKLYLQYDVGENPSFYNTKEQFLSKVKSNKPSKYVKTMKQIKKLMVYDKKLEKGRSMLSESTKEWKDRIGQRAVERMMSDTLNIIFFSGNKNKKE